MKSTESYSNLIGEKIPHPRVCNEWTLDLILIELDIAVNKLIDYVNGIDRWYYCK